jgi:hypothetical protein
MIGDLIFEKEMVEQYNVSASGGRWAFIVVDEKHLSLLINSDYGAWAFRWHNIGSQSFKEFLIGMEKDPDYLISKLAVGEKEVDVEGTIKRVREGVLECRRENPEQLSREDARSIWSEVPGIVEGSRDVNDLAWALYNHGLILETLCDNDTSAISDFTKTTPPRAVRNFVEKIYLPWFVPELKKELACQSSSSAPI